MKTVIARTEESKHVVALLDQLQPEHRRYIRDMVMRVADVARDRTAKTPRRAASQ